MESFYFKERAAAPAMHYQMLREEKAMMRGVMSGNISQAKISVEQQRQRDGNCCYQVDITEYSQSNHKGLYQWVHHLFPLRRKLLIELRGDGAIGCICNMEEVSAAWHRLRPALEREHRTEKSMLQLLDSMEAITKDGFRMADILRYTAPYINLFPPLLDKALHDAPDTERPGYREIENFIGVKSIPVLTEEYIQLEKQDDCTLVTADGTIDRITFEQHLVADLVKAIRGKANVSTEVALQYKEQYAIDRYGWPRLAMQMYAAGIPGFLKREEKVFIKNFLSWEKNMYRTAYF